LLYWDSIRCIAPEKHYFNDEIKYLSDQGVIIATNPKPYYVGASVAFVKKIKKYCYNQGELDKKVRSYLDERFPELKDVTIHRDKFCEEIFRQMGHKIQLGHFEGGISKFYHAQPYITALYLMFLATEMSNKIHAPMLTDIPGLSELGQYILWSDDIIPTEKQQDNFLMQLDIDFPSSEQLTNLSFDDILRFRHQRNDERKRFRRAVEEIRRTAQELDDSNALSDYFNEQKKEIQQAIKDHRKTLNEIGIRNFTSSLNIVWPCLFGIAIGEIAGGPAGILSAISMVSISILKNQLTVSQERHKETKDCPWHYLINLEHELK